MPWSLIVAPYLVSSNPLLRSSANFMLFWCCFVLVSNHLLDDLPYGCQSDPLLHFSHYYSLYVGHVWGQVQAYPHLLVTVSQHERWGEVLKPAGYMLTYLWLDWPCHVLSKPGFGYDCISPLIYGFWNICLCCLLSYLSIVVPNFFKLPI